MHTQKTFTRLSPGMDQIWGQNGISPGRSGWILGGQGYEVVERRFLLAHVTLQRGLPKCATCPSVQRLRLSPSSGARNLSLLPGIARNSKLHGWVPSGYPPGTSLTRRKTTPPSTTSGILLADEDTSPNQDMANIAIRRMAPGSLAASSRHVLTRNLVWARPCRSWQSVVLRLRKLKGWRPPNILQ
jgi:hypothetical protein